MYHPELTHGYSDVQLKVAPIATPDPFDVGNWNPLSEKLPALGDLIIHKNILSDGLHVLPDFHFGKVNDVTKYEPELGHIVYIYFRLDPYISFSPTKNIIKSSFGANFLIHYPKPHPCNTFWRPLDKAAVDGWKINGKYEIDLTGLKGALNLEVQDKYDLESKIQRAAEVMKFLDSRYYHSLDEQIAKEMTTLRRLQFEDGYNGRKSIGKLHPSHVEHISGFLTSHVGLRARTAQRDRASLSEIFEKQYPREASESGQPQRLRSGGRTKKKKFSRMKLRTADECHFKCNGTR